MTTHVEAVRAKLVADATVASYVATRVFANLAPQDPPLNVPPLIVCSVISDVPENSFTGDYSSTLRAVRMQVDCYATTYVAAHLLADAVDVVLSALHTPDLSAWRELSRDLYDDETQLHRVSMDFTIWR